MSQFLTCVTEHSGIPPAAVTDVYLFNIFFHERHAFLRCEVALYAIAHLHTSSAEPVRRCPSAPPHCDDLTQSPRL